MAMSLILGQTGFNFMLVTPIMKQLKIMCVQGLQRAISETDSMHLKCSTAEKKHFFLLWTKNFLFSIQLCYKPSQFFKNLNTQLWFSWKQRMCHYNCAQWAQNIKLLFSSMAFITPSSNAVYMIIYYLLFRRGRVPYKMNDFNCLINKTWINVLAK